jgi:hypothetical protein
VSGYIITAQPVVVDYTIQGMGSPYSTMYSDEIAIERYRLHSEADLAALVFNNSNPPTDDTGEHFDLHLNTTSTVEVKLVCFQRNFLCHHVGYVLWAGHYTTHISK